MKDGGRERGTPAPGRAPHVEASQRGRGYGPRPL